MNRRIISCWGGGCFFSDVGISLFKDTKHGVLFVCGLLTRAISFHGGKRVTVWYWYSLWAWGKGTEAEMNTRKQEFVSHEMPS